MKSKKTESPEIQKSDEYIPELDIEDFFCPRCSFRDTQVRLCPKHYIKLETYESNQKKRVQAHENRRKWMFAILGLGSLASQAQNIYKFAQEIFNKWIQ